MSDDAGPRAFVAGWPVAHSRSPAIHNFWLKRLGLRGRYEAVAVAPDDFSAFLRGLAGAGWRGGNVTLPHKEAAFRLVAEASPTARDLAAVNTLWLEDGRLCGDNTDAAGFLAALDEEAANWRAARGPALVLGAGGAARAVVSALRGCGREIILVNRNLARAEAVAAHFGAGARAAGWAALPALLPEAGLLVNTTSLGMRGQPPLEVDVTLLPDDAVVDDIVYTPLETGLVRAARARGLVAVGGLGMLLHQAAPGFARWFGVRPQVDAQLRALVEADVRKES